MFVFVPKRPRSWASIFAVVAIFAIVFSISSQEQTASAYSTNNRQLLAPQSGIWQIRRQWNDTLEQRYSEWIAHLFRPIATQKNRGWRVLHKVLRSPDRNTLFNRLGLREDSKESSVKVKAIADCGDTPYMLRAYFSWKMGLPFRFRHCSRGTAKKGPTCRGFVTNLTDEFDHIAHPVERFNAFLSQAIAWRAHSGTLRTLPSDEGADFYPIPLNRRAIRPGTVFVDTGGHALVVSQWNKEGLFGIDGHPDKTVTRRAFSPQFFPYAAAVDTGGFKAFRPIKVVNGTFIAASNKHLGSRFSIGQYQFHSAKGFFAHMNHLLNKN